MGSTSKKFRVGPVDYHVESADEVFALIFTNHLSEGETISSIASESVSGPDDELVVALVTVNASSFTPLNSCTAVGAGKAAQITFTTGTGTPGKRYEVLVRVLTSEGRTIPGILLVDVYD